MLDHVFVSVSDLPASIYFYEQALAPLGIRHSVDYDGADGPEGHPDLKGFGSNGRVYFWLRGGQADGRAVHIGFVASSQAEVDAAYARQSRPARLTTARRALAFTTIRATTQPNFLDPDGYSIEVVYKSWQHPQAG